MLKHYTQKLLSVLETGGDLLKVGVAALVAGMCAVILSPLLAAYADLDTLNGINDEE